MLITPSRTLREITIGALGRAQRRYGVEIHAFVFLSNHYHLLVSVEDVQQLSAFVGYFESKLAKEIGRSTGWRDKVWARRYQHIPISNETAAQVARLRYILSNGVKEHLVAHPCDWPGATSARALLEGKPLRGIWYDRTAEYNARMRRGIQPGCGPCYEAFSPLTGRDPRSARRLHGSTVPREPFGGDS